MILPPPFLQKKWPRWCDTIHPHSLRTANVFWISSPKPLVTTRVEFLCFFSMFSSQIRSVFLFVCLKSWEDCLQTRIIYLHDDAKFKLGSSLTRQAGEIYIKMLRAVATRQTWYESIGNLFSTDWFKIMIALSISSNNLSTLSLSFIVKLFYFY